MVIKTKLTELLGIKHPIVQGGMQYVGYAEMASAVSNAGALGMLTALTQPTPDALRTEIRRCRTMTKYPFGVNLTFLPAIVPPPYEEYVKAIIEEGVKVVETAGNNPIRHAISAHHLGVDVISMDGFECAGHPGEDDITAVILLAKAAKKLNLPYIASGGFADGRGLAAALALGAEGVNMGTRFMCTTEAPIHHNIKEAIVKADERSTALVFRPFRNTTRIFKNSVAVEVNKREENPEVVFEDVQELVSGARGKQVYTTGDPEFGVWTVGQVIGLIDDIPTCQDLVTRIVNDAESLIKERLNKMIVSESKL